MSKVDYLDEIKWTADGLLPAIAQDTHTGTILMMAWMNRASLALTVEQGVAIYWSRSRNRLWRKGETSGHTQLIKSIKLDCDADVIVLEVEQMGDIACHTGRKSCFYRTLTNDEWVETAPVLKDPKELYS